MKFPRILFPLMFDPHAREGEPPANDPPAGDPPAGDPPPGGLLTGQAPAGAAPAGEFTVPEKFLVKNAEGKEDWEQIARKALPAYVHLEKRLGSGEAPPESPDKYKLERWLPEGFEADPERERMVLAELHKLGLSNKQAQGVLAYYGQTLAGALSEEKSAMEAATAELQQEFGKDFDSRMGRVNFTLSQAPANIVQAVTSDPKLMNNPTVIRLLDWIAREFEDDHAADQMDAGEIEEVEQLMHSEAYLKEGHPDHKRVAGKVAAAFARGYKPKN